MNDYESGADREPLDRTTGRVISELVSRLLPPLSRVLSESLASGAKSGDELEGALHAEADRLAQLLNESATALQEELNGLSEKTEQTRGTLARAREELREILQRGFDGAASDRQEIVRAAAVLAESRGSISSGPDESKTISHAGAERAARETRERAERLERLIKSGIDEERAGRQALLQPFGSVLELLSSVRGQLSEVMEALKDLRQDRTDSAGHPAPADRVEAVLNETRHALSELAGEVASLIKSLNESSRTSTDSLTTDRAAARSVPSNDSGEVTQLLKVSIPSWEGLLRAHSQAQSRELESLSQELSDLQEQGRATLIQSLEDALSREAANRDAEWEERLEEERARTEQKTAALMKILWGVAGLGGVSLLLSLIRLFY